MSGFSSPYTVPEDRPVPEPILRILTVAHRVALKEECPYVVVGATARDLLLFHVFGIPATRATQDVDFAIAVESWERFHSMRSALLATRDFVPTKMEHRLFFRATAIPIDLIPFGGVAENDTILWPQTKDTAISVAGFEDAMAAAIQVQVGPALTVPVVSLAALAVLKIFAWADRNETDKDALDLYRVISTYADAGNEERLYGPDSPHLEKFDHDVERAGAALAGEDSRMLSSSSTITRLRTFVSSVDSIDLLAERVRNSRWHFEPEKLPILRGVLAAYFDELLK
jgi:predicted nucleotidyltransferase